MAKATFAEYEAAKFEIIGGVEYKEETQFPNQWGMMSKQYHTAENGNFYESMDPDTGIVEFWSDKHPESRYYQDYVYKQAKEPQPAAEPEQQPEYGSKLAEEIRTTTEDFSKDRKSVV